MREIHAGAILFLSSEMAAVALAILALFHARHRFGLGPLYIFIGSLQYLQTVLASTLYLDLGFGVAVSPGSAVLFSSSLFAILLTYLRESIPATRTLIAGIVVSNIGLSSLAWVTEHQLLWLDSQNLLGLPRELFRLDTRVFLVGTVTLVLDSFLIVIVYELILRRAGRLAEGFRVILALLLVLYFDAAVFTAGSFLGTGAFEGALFDQLWGKSLAALVFGSLLSAYLKMTSTRAVRASLEGDSGPLSILTYRQRYEVVREQLAVEKEASRAKSRFLAHMSHELRTPMTAIIGFTNVLAKNRERRLGDKDLLYLERIRINAHHLLDLINGLLDLSRIEAGRLELDLEETDLSALVREAVAQLESQAIEKGLSLRVEAPAGELIALVDRRRFKQILINLLGNAFRFTAEGGVDVRLRVDEASGRLRAVEVRDTGPGISAADQERIFRPFEQVRDPDVRPQGTGLGLAISQVLSQSMGFAIEVESEIGRGSTFRIVPRGREALAPSPEEPSRG